MSHENDLIVVISTIESQSEADQLANELVQRSLAACVQIDGPIRSHYRWAGEVQISAEYRLMIKSRYGAWPALKAKLLDLHPYDEPQIVMLPAGDATHGYRAWVVDQTS